MSKLDRRDAVRRYKERKIPVGVFSIRCTATGESWVAASRNLDQQQNGLWFSLRLGSNPNKPLQAAWRTHGETAFAFERLEVIEPEDLSATALALRLKDAERRWREKLGAGKVFG